MQTLMLRALLLLFFSFSFFLYFIFSFSRLFFPQFSNQNTKMRKHFSCKRQVSFLYCAKFSGENAAGKRLVLFANYIRREAHAILCTKRTEFLFWRWLGMSCKSATATSTAIGMCVYSYIVLLLCEFVSTLFFCHSLSLCITLFFFRSPSGIGWNCISGLWQTNLFNFLHQSNDAIFPTSFFSHRMGTIWSPGVFFLFCLDLVTHCADIGFWVWCI